MSLIKINNIIDIENNIFKFNDKNITITYDEYNNVWFKGKDVCNILEYKKSENAIKRHVEDEDKIEYKKLKVSNPRETRGLLTVNKSLHPDTIYINESGLYCLVFSSKLPQAKEFKLWVTR